MTITDVLTWPGSLAPKAVTLRLAGQALVGPSSLTGRVQVMQADPYWEVVASGIPVGGQADVLAWRAFLALMEGGVRPAYVPVWDYAQAPWPAAGGRSANEVADSKFSDNTVFTDATGFYNPSILVSLSADASLRDTEITVTKTAAGTILAGMVFSLFGERLHTIRAINDDGSWSIWPPLRQDYVSGTNLEFGRPTVRAILSSPADGELALTMGRYGAADMTFREVI